MQNRPSCQGYYHQIYTEKQVQVKLSQIYTGLVTLSYTESKYIEDKWVEWSESQSKLVPNNTDEDSILVCL